ncbi:hypothetical protein L1887_24068 [Cichorium endivia]|nr:hypothetical protein L1887_24068 [Cichorium endivia]
MDSCPLASMSTSTITTTAFATLTSVPPFATLGISRLPLQPTIPNPHIRRGVVISSTLTFSTIISTTAAHGSGASRFGALGSSALESSDRGKTLVVELRKEERKRKRLE